MLPMCMLAVPARPPQYKLCITPSLPPPPTAPPPNPIPTPTPTPVTPGPAAGHSGGLWPLCQCSDLPPGWAGCCGGDGGQQGRRSSHQQRGGQDQPAHVSAVGLQGLCSLQTGLRGQCERQTLHCAVCSVQTLSRHTPVCLVVVAASCQQFVLCESIQKPDMLLLLLLLQAPDGRRMTNADYINDNSKTARVTVTGQINAVSHSMRRSP